jgi:hypothetical protein
VNPEILRTVEVAAQALAAARAAQTWADSVFATTNNREFLAMMASAEARRAREGARWLVSLATHYRESGDPEYAHEIANMAQQVEGSAAGAEEAARKCGAIAKQARETDDRIRAKRASAIKIELLREHADRTDVIDVYVIPGIKPEIYESVLRETRWPNLKITGRTLAHPVELTAAEREEVAQRLVANRWEGAAS